MNTEKQYPHEILAEILPEILAEGPVLLEFKTDEITDIKPSMIVTLDENICPINNKPVDNEDNGKIWCWNVHRGGWYLLDCYDVESAQTWPPEIIKESE